MQTVESAGLFWPLFSPHDAALDAKTAIRHHAFLPSRPPGEQGFSFFDPIWVPRLCGNLPSLAPPDPKTVSLSFLECS